MGALQGTRPGRMKSRSLPPTVETSSAFVDRALRWWDSTILPLSRADIISEELPTSNNDVEEEPICVLVVTHGAYISTLVRAGLIAERNFRGRLKCNAPLYNTSITVVQVDEGGATGEVLVFADVNHLLTPATARNADELRG
jgi:broad specificity phosphatase PhoE